MKKQPKQKLPEQLECNAFFHRIAYCCPQGGEYAGGGGGVVAGAVLLLLLLAKMTRREKDGDNDNLRLKSMAKKTNFT